VSYKALVDGPAALEARTHNRFAAVRERKEREFFRVPAPEVIDVLRELIGGDGPLTRILIKQL
jgi:hypothetical protein